MVRCPHPSCDYLAEAITNNHCQSAHGVTKSELFKCHGLPELVILPNPPKGQWETYTTAKQTTPTLGRSGSRSRAKKTGR